MKNAGVLQVEDNPDDKALSVDLGGGALVGAQAVELEWQSLRRIERVSIWVKSLLAAIGSPPLGQKYNAKQNLRSDREAGRQ